MTQLTTARRRTMPAHRLSVPTILVMSALLLYCVLPFWWLIVSSTKSNGDLFSTFGLWFGRAFSLFDNLGQLFTHQNGIYLEWLGNTVLYAVVGGVGATILATLGGYGLASFTFPGSRKILGIVIVAMAVPATALAIPMFLLFSSLGIVNTRWIIVLLSLASPLGLYLMQVFAAQAVPRELLEAARLDGASETRIFVTIVSKLLAPGFVTVLLFNVVAIWNNYFLPLIMLSDPRLYPLTVGLNQWNSQASGSSGATEALYNLVVTGSLVGILPLVIVFVVLQRYWVAGLAAGSSR